MVSLLISLIYVMTLCNDEFYRTKREAHSLLIEHRRLPTKLNSSLFIQISLPVMSCDCSSHGVGCPGGWPCMSRLILDNK